jgi:type IV pilus assembly protein PilB
MSQRLGDLLVKEKVITPEQLEQATKLQKESHIRLASALVKLGFLSDEDVTNFLSRQYGVPAINLSYFEIDPAVVKLIPFETAKRYQILPLSPASISNRSSHPRVPSSRASTRPTALPKKKSSNR